MTDREPGEVQNLDTISGAAFVTAMLVALAIYYSFYIPGIRQGVEAGSWSAADAPWLQAHITAYLVSFLLFFTGFIVSVIYTYVRGRPRYPWVESSAVIATLLAVGGLIAGMVFAKPIWGVWWVWDLKNTFVLAATVVLVLITPLAALNKSFATSLQRDTALVVPLFIALLLYIISLVIGILSIGSIHPVWLLQWLLQLSFCSSVPVI